MIKIGRNEPCPCGSGRKYKHCCLKIDESNYSNNGDNPLAKTLAEITRAVEGQEFESLEELQGFVDNFMAVKNREAVPGFLGFSSDQIHRLLYYSFEDTADILEFNKNLPEETLAKIPVVKNVQLFLSRLAELEPLRATAKGNLPLKFARELHEQFTQREDLHYKIRSEEKSAKLHPLRHVLTMCGWLKKRRQQFSLTRKGRQIVDKGFTGEHYLQLFKVYTRKFNWGFLDGFLDLWIIQGGFLFSLYLLRLKAVDFVEDVALADYFMEAFPRALDEAAEETYWEPPKTVAIAFSSRFLVRFCEYFGLVEAKRREERELYRTRLYVKTTEFYDQFLVWKGP